MKDESSRTLFDKRIRSERLYAKDIIANCTIINPDTSHMIGYTLSKGHINFYFYTPVTSNVPTIYFDVNNNNKEDVLIDRFYRQVRDKVTSQYLEGKLVPTKRVFTFGGNLMLITYPVAEVSQSNIIAFQVVYRNWDTGFEKDVFVPSRKHEVDFKKKNLFYITIPQ
ncbi:MAG: hypothetical protein SGI83_08605 [Bacteroidota bacterium]|nr:hypothetical protein [Bacteroidota bacterium]